MTNGCTNETLKQADHISHESYMWLWPSVTDNVSLITCCRPSLYGLRESRVCDARAWSHKGWVKYVCLYEEEVYDCVFQEVNGHMLYVWSDDATQWPTSQVTFDFYSLPLEHCKQHLRFKIWKWLGLSRVMVRLGLGLGLEIKASIFFILSHSSHIHYKLTVETKTFSGGLDTLVLLLWHFLGW